MLVRRQDIGEIAAWVIDLDDRETQGHGLQLRAPEAHRGKVHRAADYAIANGTINPLPIAR
jgi:hypothetical protein